MAALESAAKNIKDNLRQAGAKGAALIQREVTLNIRNQKFNHVPLSPKTLKRKKGTQILIDEGDYYRSWEIYEGATEFIVGTSEPQAAAMEFGHEEGGIPARPHLGKTLEEKQNEINGCFREGVEKTFEL